MFKLSRLATLLLTAACLSQPVLAADKAKSFATVNGQAIPQYVFDAFVAEQKAQGKGDDPELATAVKEELVRREVLAQEARKKGLDKTPDVQGQMELARQAVLIRAYLSEYVRANPISEARLKADYDTIRAKLGSTEFKARHILVESEDEAKALITKLDTGEKFADLAKASKDPGSRDNGGELGWSSPNSYVPSFASALQALKKGEYTKTPVKTDFGYHVILLDDTRPLNAPAFDQVRQQLQQRAGQQQVEQLVKELRAKAKVN